MTCISRFTRDDNPRNYSSKYLGIMLIIVLNVLIVLLFFKPTMAPIFISYCCLIVLNKMQLTS